MLLSAGAPCELYIASRALSTLLGTPTGKQAVLALSFALVFLCVCVLDCRALCWIVSVLLAAVVLRGDCLRTYAVWCCIALRCPPNSAAYAQPLSLAAHCNSCPQHRRQHQLHSAYLGTQSLRLPTSRRLPCQVRAVFPVSLSLLRFCFGLLCFTTPSPPQMFSARVVWYWSGRDALCAAALPAACPSTAAGASAVCGQHWLLWRIHCNIFFGVGAASLCVVSSPFLAVWWGHSCLL